MIKRHKKETLDVVIKMSDAGYTQAEAARELKMCPRQLNNYLKRNEINWKVKKR